MIECVHERKWNANFLNFIFNLPTNEFAIVALSTLGKCQAVNTDDAILVESSTMRCDVTVDWSFSVL